MNAVNDSTGAQRDRNTNFRWPRATGSTSARWAGTAATIIFTSHGVGSTTEYTRINGPDGFSLRINEQAPDLSDAFLFADDPLV